MRGIIDRFEEGYIVVEVNDKIYNIDKDIAKDNLKEGDVVDLILENEKVISIKKNDTKTQARKKQIEDLVKDMWK